MSFHNLSYFMINVCVCSGILRCWASRFQPSDLKNYTKTKHIVKQIIPASWKLLNSSLLSDAGDVIMPGLFL